MTSDTPPQPTACLLHADIHVMAADCWDATLDYYMQHQGEPEGVQRDGYQAAVERRMLDTIRVGHAVDHAVPPPVDRAVRRDHALCGSHPCSDCR